jgi:hypothetical protein
MIANHSIEKRGTPMSEEHMVFYLHEDEWGMVSMLPHENLAFLHEERERLDAFSDAHFDGSGWTDIYIRSEEPSPITIRAIPYVRLAEIFGSLLPAADRVETGYSTYREPCPGCFAFGKTYGLAIYGSVQDGTVTELYLSLPHLPIDAALRQGLVTALCALGMEYTLVLMDWYRSLIINLADQAAVDRYLSGETDA